MNLQNTYKTKLKFISQLIYRTTKTFHWFLSVFIVLTWSLNVYIPLPKKVPYLSGQCGPLCIQTKSGIRENTHFIFVFKLVKLSKVSVPPTSCWSVYWYNNIKQLLLYIHALQLQFHLKVVFLYFFRSWNTAKCKNTYSITKVYVKNFRTKYANK